jgi:hypothetical protein
LELFDKKNLRSKISLKNERLKNIYNCKLFGLCMNGKYKLNVLFCRVFIFNIFCCMYASPRVKMCSPL